LNADEQLIRGILQTRLLTLGWEERTSYEGKGFIGAQPDATTPYQEVVTVFSEAQASSGASSRFAYSGR
jgi:hypothetical protein